MNVEIQKAVNFKGYESLNMDDTQFAHDAHYVNRVSLYSGHPREMADLEPDNGDDPNDAGKPAVWTLV